MVWIVLNITSSISLYSIICMKRVARTILSLLELQVTGFTRDGLSTWILVRFMYVLLKNVNFIGFSLNCTST